MLVVCRALTASAAATTVDIIAKCEYALDRHAMIEECNTGQLPHHDTIQTQIITTSLMNSSEVGKIIAGLREVPPQRCLSLEPHEIVVNLPSMDRLSLTVAISQIIANIAVIIAIIIAILQLRSTQSSASSVAEQYHTQAMNEFWMTLAADADLAYIYQKGRKEPGDLADKDKSRFFYTCATWFSLHELLFVQAQGDHVTDRYYKDWLEALREDMGDKGFQQYWLKERDYFDDEFMVFIDGLIKDEATE